MPELDPLVAGDALEWDVGLPPPLIILAAFFKAADSIVDEN